MVRTANPALNNDTFVNTARTGVSDGKVMTLMGTVHKTGILLLLVLLSASWVWGKFFAQESIGVYTVVGALGGLVAALATVFKKELSAYTAPAYAVLEGLFLGGFSAMFEARFPGIVIQAVALTFGTLFALLVAYRSGLIKPTENFKLGVFAATGAIGLFYLASMILGFFHVNVPGLNDATPLGIAISVVIVIVAALNLVLDFDFIEKGAQMRVPKYMEWYAGFGLLVTLIWLYVEILRLLSKIRSRN